MSDAGQLEARLRALIRDVADFPRPGILFRDITPLLGDAVIWREAVSALAAFAHEHRAEAVAGIEARGFIVGAAVALQLGAPFVPVRKVGRLPLATAAMSYSLEYGEAVLEVHADALPPGTSVVVVDDLLATGGTAATAGALLEQIGGRVVAYAFLIELQTLGGAARLGQPVHALVRY